MSDMTNATTPDLSTLTADGDTLDVTDSLTLKLRVENDPDDNVRNYSDEAYGSFSRYDYRDDEREPRPDDMNGRAEKLPVSRGYWTWWQAPMELVPGTEEHSTFRAHVRELLECGFYIVTLEARRGEDAYGRPIVVAVSSLGGVDSPDAEYVSSIVEELWADVADQLEVRSCAVCGVSIVEEVEESWRGWLDVANGDQLSYVPTLHDHAPEMEPTTEQNLNIHRAIQQARSTESDAL